MPTVLLDGVLFKHGMSAGAAQEALAYVASAQEIASTAYGDYLSALKQGAQAEQSQRLAIFLNSPEVKLRTAIRVAKRMKLRDRPTLERCVDIAGKLDLYGPIYETSRIRARGKPSGGIRVTHSFGIQRRTAQHMVKQALSPNVILQPFQYTHKGAYEAILAVREALASGFRYYAHLDVREFFPSFELEMLAPELPLPMEVVQWVVVGRHVATVLDMAEGKGHQPILLPYPHTLQSLTHEARRGLPLGSISSPIVGVNSVSHLDWVPIKTARLFNYADNFLVVATNKARLEKRMEKLIGSVGKMPGGSFILKPISEGLATEGIEFLGHVMKTTASGAVQVHLSEKAQNAFYKELVEWEKILSAKGYLKGHYDKQSCIDTIAHMLSYVAGWREAFKLCAGVDEWASWAKDEIVAHCQKLNLPYAEVAQAVNAIPAVRPTTYAL